MAWALFLLGAIALVHAVNALAPRRRPPALMAWSFFASWLTIELAWHHLVLGSAVTVLLVVGGALESPIGVVGLVLHVVALGILGWIAGVTRRTTVSMQGALADLDPGPDAPRFPRSRIVFPFLLGRRKGVRVQRNITFARVAGKRLKLDVTIPSAPVPGGGPRRPAIMQVHGGAWVIGDKREQGLPLLGHMAAQGWVGFNVNYRLSPGATFPDHLVDLKRGVAWIREHAEEYGIDPSFICVTGGSAGGHLTALLGLTANEARFQPGFEEADTSFAAAVPFYGLYDFTDEGAFGADPELFRKFLEPIVMKAFLDEEPEKFRAASPVHHLRPDAPPFLIIHGDLDTLAPVEDARSFAERLRAVSTSPVLYAEMRGAQHAFEILPSPRAAKVIEGVERFLTTLWGRRELDGADGAEPVLVDGLSERPAG
jgi:acetyl esterase/lipase